MGMLFNTEATLQILRKANAVFNRNGLKQIKLDGGWDATASSLAPGTPGIKIYPTLAKALGIEFDESIGGLTPKAKRWRKYCDYLDKKADTAHGGVTLAQRIGAGISTAISAGGGAQYVAIEFFAAHAAAGGGVDSVALTDFVTANPAETTMIITIYTSPADTAFAALDAAIAKDPNIVTF